MTDIEQKYGKHTALVEAFLTHLESGNVDWAATWDAAWAAARDATWAATRDATRDAARAAAWDAARAAAWAAAWAAARDAAAYAACEILGHELLAARGKPLVFLPMFGIKSIEQLKEMVK